jgi:iron complex outermembrane receptor protein
MFDDARGLAFPDLLGNLIATYRPGNFRFTYRLQRAGKQYMELANIDDFAIDGYTVSSLSAGYTVPDFFELGRMTVTATVDNLFDAKYETSGYGWNYGLADNPGDPVTLTGGAEYYVAAERSYFVQLNWEFF